MDEVYQGPVLHNGFILDADLEAAGLPTQVCAGELVSLIMNLPGVAAVRALQLNYSRPDERLARGETLGCLPVRPGAKPVLDTDRCVLHFFKDLLPFTEAPQRVEAELQTLRAVSETVSSPDLPVPYGRFRDLSGYLSAQQDLPVAYGLAPHGLPSTASSERRIEARQLQGFLLLFDQILANYLGSPLDLIHRINVAPASLSIVELHEAGHVGVPVVNHTFHPGGWR
jgi:hypothetical protein